jgi:SAM-dependent methyltransferase
VITDDELGALLHAFFSEQECSYIALSGSYAKSAEAPTKVTYRPVKMRQAVQWQASEQRGNKVYHRNIAPAELAEDLQTLLAAHFKQAVLFGNRNDLHVMHSRKGGYTFLRKPPSRSLMIAEHNRPKEYLLPTGEPIDFLIKLKVMRPTGELHSNKSDKFRQINRFLEIVDDTLGNFSAHQELNIIDFGCGKAYLSFALYYYLTKIKGFTVSILGLDLKADVIAFCNQLAQELDYKGLHFAVGDINSCANPCSRVDMVVCLHACDTATDAALERAVRWQARVILAVPCCQHELYSKIESQPLETLLRHGVLRERFAALATDAARAELLEMMGYKCQVMEFIDLEHTPKNLLLRAIRQQGNSTQRQKLAANRYRAFAKGLSITPDLERRFAQELTSLGGTPP